MIVLRPETSENKKIKVRIWINQNNCETFECESIGIKINDLNNDNELALISTYINPNTTNINISSKIKPEEDNKPLMCVYKIEWTEYENGWGNRPDGITYHKNFNTAEIYRKKLESQGNFEIFVRGTIPTLIEIDNKELFDKIQKEESIRIS